MDSAPYIVLDMQQGSPASGGEKASGRQAVGQSALWSPVVRPLKTLPPPLCVGLALPALLHIYRIMRSRSGASQGSLEFRAQLALSVPAAPRGLLAFCLQTGSPPSFPKLTRGYKPGWTLANESLAGVS